MVEFLNLCKEYNDICAFRVLDGDNTKEISYLEFYQEMEACAYSLSKKLGDLKGRRIGLYFDSSYEYLVVLGAIIFSRAVAIPLNRFESIENICYQIEKADVTDLITDEEHISAFSHFEGGLIDKTEILSDKEGCFGLTDFDDSEEDSISLLIFTSGTTGKAKGVVLSAGSLFKNIKTLYDSSAPFDSYEGLKIYINFPFYHIGGITAWITHFEYKCTTYLSVNPANVLTDLETEQVDATVVTPATLKLWKKSINRGHIERLGQTKLIVSAGAPVDYDTLDAFLQNGICYGQYYGMSESCGNISQNFDCKKHLKSVGRADEGVEVIIIDDEICVRSRTLMKGYYKDEEETQKTIIDGILHTGDLGYVDEDGYIYITGRKKNLIILSGGENVSPEELEQKMYACSHVRECKAFEKNDRIFVEVYCSEETRDDVRAHVTELNKTLPIYKRIYGVEFRDQEFDKTASGKIRR